METAETIKQFGVATGNISKLCLLANIRKGDNLVMILIRKKIEVQIIEILTGVILIRLCVPVSICK
jgi:hypothetical protein